MATRLAHACGEEAPAAGDGIEPPTRTIRLMKGLLEENDRVAADLRRTFAEYGIACVNLMSSPGSGKTSLLEGTARGLRGRARMAVIEGDLETENDADRIRRHGVPAVQITTGVTCHLNAELVRDAIAQLDLGAIDILFIENVGNLVCPADFDLGQAASVVLLSITEGDDKPLKYPQIFRAADLVLLSKADLGPVIEEFDAARAAGAVRTIGGPDDIRTVSAKSGLGMGAWVDWIEEKIQIAKASRSNLA